MKLLKSEDIERLSNSVLSYIALVSGTDTDKFTGYSKKAIDFIQHFKEFAKYEKVLFRAFRHEPNYLKIGVKIKGQYHFTSDRAFAITHATNFNRDSNTIVLMECYGIEAISCNEVAENLIDELKTCLNTIDLIKNKNTLTKHDYELIDAESKLRSDLQAISSTHGTYESEYEYVPINGDFIIALTKKRNELKVPLNISMQVFLKNI